MGEIKVCIWTIESPCSLIISHGSFFSCGKRTKLEPGSLLWLSYLSNPFAPSSVPNASVLAGGVLGPAFPPCWPFLPWLQRGLLASIHGSGKMVFSESLEEEINSFVLHYIRLLNPHTINENSLESIVISSEIYDFVEISCVAITFF